MARNTHQESGKVLYDTMTKSERRGYHKLRKRSQANELVISTTDKSTEITISSFESYAQQGEPHVAKDRNVTWKEVNLSKREVLCHVKGLNHVFNNGQDNVEKNQERLGKAFVENRTIVPDMILLQKNQKPVDTQTGLPKTRPVCLAKSTFNQRANDHLCMILGATIHSDPTCESISTEDNLSKVDALNAKIVKGEVNPNKLVLGSLDVQALYPSISTKAAGTIVRDRILKSEAKFDGVDYVWGLKYLALTMSNCEKVNARIQGLIPRKISKSGRKPSILSVVTDEVRERWWFPNPTLF